MAAQEGAAPGLVELNVGGVCYTTTRSTLTRYPDTMLARMVLGQLPTTTDSHGRYFIDRNGELFQYVLDYLRTAQLALTEDKDLLRYVGIEADFYQIEALHEAVRTALEPSSFKVHVLEVIKGFWHNHYGVRVFGTQESLQLIGSDPQHIKPVEDMEHQIEGYFVEYLDPLTCDQRLAPAVMTQLEEYFRNHNWELDFTDREPERSTNYCEKWILRTTLCQ